MVKHGEELLWLQTYGERLYTDQRPKKIPSSQLIKWVQKPKRIPDDSKDFSYNSETLRLNIADGSIVNVSPEIWNFEVSGMQVVKKWLGYRTAKGAGKAMNSSSPLDHIRPDTWDPEWSKELIELLTVLERTINLLPIGIGLLEEICKGPLLKAKDLPPIPEGMRKPPNVNKEGNQLSF